MSNEFQNAVPFKEVSCRTWMAQVNWKLVYSIIINYFLSCKFLKFFSYKILLLVLVTNPIFFTLDVPFLGFMYKHYVLNVFVSIPYVFDDVVCLFMARKIVSSPVTLCLFIPFNFQCLLSPGIFFYYDKR